MANAIPSVAIEAKVSSLVTHGDSFPELYTLALASKTGQKCSSSSGLKFQDYGQSLLETLVKGLVELDGANGPVEL